MNAELIFDTYACTIASFSTNNKHPAHTDARRRHYHASTAYPDWMDPPAEDGAQAPPNDARRCYAIKIIGSFLDGHLPRVARKPGHSTSLTH
jgi:hypothetical protein